MAGIHRATQDILTDNIPGVRESLRMSEAATRVRVREFRLILTQPEELAGALKRIDDGRRQVDEARRRYEAAIRDDAERALYAKAEAAWAAYLVNSDAMIEAQRAGRVDEAKDRVLVQGVKLFDVAAAAFGELAKHNDRAAAENGDAVEALYANSRVWVASVVVLTVLLAGALGFVIARAITKPLHRAVALAQAVAEGDLSQTPQAAGRDEVAALTRALAQMTGQLRQVVSEVRNGVESVGTASTQIASGNLDLSQRTEAQASNLQQTAASMEELTATVRQNADTARRATELAGGASQAAAQGGSAVERVVETMQGIAGSSRQIAEITGVIDGIAFQTNILALNAAVEAARAGEQGRGFAVVASEVRTLAQRSADAARQIKALIGDSAARVDSGTRQVADAGASMREIVAQVQRVSALIEQIATASAEQSSGITQVGQAVSQLDQVTQRNAALVEESAAAAESMKQQAARLGEVVRMFRFEPALA